MTKHVISLRSPYGRKFQFPLGNVRQVRITKQTEVLSDLRFQFSDSSSISIASHGTAERVAETLRSQNIPVEIIPR